jgi:hypothetical protein
MAQADCVFSTPPTNTSVTRRSVLGTAAGAAAALAATGASPMAASPAPDPIFAAIDAFRRADASCVAVHGDIPDELGDQCFDAYSVVLRTRPTTPAGLAALTTWAREQADWLRANSTILHGEDLCALTASIDDATRGMSGLEPWSPRQPALPFAAAIPTTAEATADPAFALIAEKLAADIAHCEAIDAQDEAESGHGIRSDAAEEAFQRCSVACSVVNEADWRLATTPPTTFAGVAAVLRFANEIEDAGLEWPDTDTIGREGWHYQLRATMAAAIETLIKAQAGKAVV